MRFFPWFLVLAGPACNGDGGDDDNPDVVDTGMAIDTVDTADDPTPVLPDGVEVVDCSRELPAPPSGQTCAVTGDPATATAVILQGDVLGDPDTYLQGELRFALGVENATLECVGCDCSTSEETVVISCPDAVITPGLINAHDHIRYAAETVKEIGNERYDHRHDWRRGTRDHTPIPTDSNNAPEVTLYGEMRMLFAGATSIAGSIAGVNASGLMRNLDNATYNEGLNPGDVDYSTFPLGDALNPVLEVENCLRFRPESSAVLSNEIYLPHVAEGIDPEARNEFACLSGEGPGSVDYIADNTSIVHGIGLNAADIALVASRDAQLVWSPRSNLSLYGDTAQVVTYDSFEVPIALGTDWIPSGSATMLRELACADQFNREHLGGYFSDYALWRMVTANAALAMGVDDQLGRLAEGLLADVAVIAKGGNALHGAVVRADTPDVALVLRGGRALTGEEPLVAGLLGSTDACDALGECLSGHVVCIDRPGFTLDSIDAVVPNDAFPLYVCGEPDEEPTCEPFRDDESGDGVIYPTSSTMDQDRDGQDDDVDNCPTIFNPPRALGGWRQVDFDGDGSGDACDVCPLAPGAECDLDDLDGDGVDNVDDNCPLTANPDQTDADADGLGAACERCDDFASAVGACEVAVYDVKQGLHTGELVEIDDLVVTAIRAGEGFFAQLDPGAPGYAGVDYSGIYTYSPSEVGSVSVGDSIRVAAGVQDFFGQLQLSNVTSIVVNPQGAPLPAPVVVSADDVATGGTRADALEGVLVSVLDVEVTAVNPDGNPAEFEVDSSLFVNDFLYTVDPVPTVGDTFTAITGVLRWSFDEHRLEPRGVEDVAFGEVRVDALTPGFLPVAVGATESLTVSLRFPSGSLETVQIDCLPAGSLLCPPSVDVPAGQLSADFIVEGLQANAVVVSGTLGTSSAQADVQVYDDATTRTVVDLAPAVLTVAPSGVGTLVVTIDLPAPSGGLDLAVTADPGITVPPTVSVLPGETTVDVPVTAGAALGTYAVSVGGLTADVDVASAPQGQGLAFWEYTEPRSGGVPFINKFLEIKNLEPSAFDLTGCRVDDYVNGQSTPNASRSFDLQPIVLQPGGIYLVCPDDPSRIAVGGTCDQERGNQFNGDDTLVLSCGGVVMDVFGQIGTDPGTEWGDSALGTESTTLRRRCDVVAGDADGSDAFDLSEWIQISDDADGTNLGLDHCP